MNEKVRVFYDEKNDIYHLLKNIIEQKIEENFNE